MAVAPAAPAASDALAGVLASTIALNDEVGRTLNLLGELARRSEIRALSPREHENLAVCAVSVIPTISKAREALLEARERLRWASGLRRRGS